MSTIGDLERALLEVVEACAVTGGLNAFLSNSIAREGRTKVKKMQQERIDAERDRAKQEKQRKAEMLEEQRVEEREERRKRRELMQSIRDAAKSQGLVPEVTDADVREIERSDGRPGDIPFPVRKYMVEKVGINKCRWCGLVAFVDEFRSCEDPVRVRDCKRCWEKPEVQADHFDRFIAMLIRNAKSRAKTRKKDGKAGHAFNLSVEWAREHLAAINNRCELCARPMTSYLIQEGGPPVELSGKSWLNGTGSNVSVDRIDSSRGYTTDNVQMTHLACNLSKRDTSMEEFVTMCVHVARLHGSILTEENDKDDDADNAN
nr:hypothetical protein [Sicyoidochytrium minutum DNA virus]